MAVWRPDMPALEVDFIGRSAELDQLRSMLFSDRRSGKVNVTGLGGIGKTSFVSIFVRTNADLFPDGTEFVSAPLQERSAGPSFQLPARIETRFCS